MDRVVPADGLPKTTAAVIFGVEVEEADIFSSREFTSRSDDIWSNSTIIIYAGTETQMPREDEGLKDEGSKDEGLISLADN